MVLAIDTSASTSLIATIDAGGDIQDYRLPARSPELIPQLRRLAAEKRVEKIAVATGPGSFTGLRVGVSFGLGLAIGLKIPIVPLPTLAIQAARARGPATAVVEAGRGRFYYLTPEGQKGLGEPSEVPRAYELVGNVSASGRAALEAAGQSFLSEEGLQGFGEAVAILLVKAVEVAYGSLEIEYMQSFSAHS